MAYAQPSDILGKSMVSPSLAHTSRDSRVGTPLLVSTACPLVPNGDKLINPFSKPLVARSTGSLIRPSFSGMIPTTGSTIDPFAQRLVPKCAAGVAP